MLKSAGLGARLALSSAVRPRTITARTAIRIATRPIGWWTRPFADSERKRHSESAANPTTMRIAAIQPIGVRDVLDRESTQHRVVEAERTTRPDQLERHRLQGQEEGQGHHERRDPEVGHQGADREADQRTEGDAGERRCPPRPVVVDEHERDDRGRGAAGDTGGEVDLAEEQDEDDAHGQDDDRAGLHDQVGHVVGREEPVVGRGEDDDQEDQAEDRGQGAHVAATQAVEVVAGRVADAGRPGGCRCRSRRVGEAAGAGLGVGVDGHGGVSGPGQTAAVAGFSAMPRSPERPAVMSSTIWLCVTSFAGTSAATWPR